ncbi:Tryptophan 7-halogenase [Saliniradius amylolyticus]|uniref:Tryptophan 7-halogenase n=1 Tax=Saliniradius amylolyticus TaxID=2183582 RepID=A0A2S2E3Z6_9ALTE|nr:tryptophan halogenase family protein [Saliniradius amylolyticus]AWL11970.1 Tryptophan 7-halogenase [Saliniradius amylolyticus]
MSPIHNIVVLGGGTAGWLAANHLAKALNCRDSDEISVTLVESPDVPTIGVGEGTVPHIRHTLKYLGISETDVLRHCQATLKQSIQFINWNDSPSHRGKHSYHHLFDYPDMSRGDLTPYWLLSETKTPYADYVSVQSHLIHQGLAPKSMMHPEYQGVTEYAYHMDALKFSELLASHATEKLGVKRVSGHVTQPLLHPNGDIKALQFKDGNTLEGDFFVDASGFNARLLSDAYQIPLIDKRHVLLADTALALQVPYSQPDAAIPCSTLATAQEHGWIWDIGLTQRRGVGYVYSSAHTSEQQAADTLSQYLVQSGNAADLDYRRIPMQVGYRQQFWHRNCCAIGLSQGFVEPLEATGLLMFDLTARMLADTLPARRDQLAHAAKRYNQHVCYAWERVIDFIKLHYCISRRDDSDFWRDNREPASIPEHLSDKLYRWRYQVPSAYDFAQTNSIFNLDNYLYVLYGMEYHTDISAGAFRYAHSQQARQQAQFLKQMADQQSKQLMSHRKFLELAGQHGLQRI